MFWKIFFPVLLAGFLNSALGRAESLTDYGNYKKQILKEFQGLSPHLWGETIPGIRTRLKTDQPVLALTLDACGSDGDGYDEKLISFLEAEKIPATLFINARWIEKNPETFGYLMNHSLFEIANHGFLHKPASVNGRGVYGLEGTKDLDELVDEIELNGQMIEELSGRRPRYYRSGTAYYDDVALKVAVQLGYEVVGFKVLGDKGATYSAAEVERAMLASQPGDIVLLHMNHPEKETAEGVLQAVSKLRAKGFKFVRLSDYPFDS